MFESEKSENGKSLHRAEEYGRMRRKLSGETNSNKVFLFDREFRWAFLEDVKVMILHFSGAYLQKSV